MTGNTGNRKRAWTGKSDPVLVLDFASDAIRLMSPGDTGTLAAIGEAALDQPDFADRIAALRVEATVRGGAGHPVALRLPPEQIVCRSLVLNGPQSARHRDASERLAAQIDCPVAELLIALSPPGPGDEHTVVGALRQTATEAVAYARRWGFEPGPILSSVGGDAFAEANPRLVPPGPVQTSGRRSSRQAAAIAACLCVTAAVGIAAVHYGPAVLESAAPLKERPGLAALSEPADPGLWRLDLARDSTPDPVRVKTPRRTALRPAPIEGVRTGSSAPKHLPMTTVAAAPAVPLPPTPSAAMRVGAAPTHVTIARPGRLKAIDPSVTPAAALPITPPLGPDLDVHELPADPPPIAIVAAATGVTATDADPLAPVVLAADEDLTPTEVAPSDMEAPPPGRPRRETPTPVAEVPTPASPSLAAPVLGQERPVARVPDPDAPTEHAALEAPPPPDRPERLAARYLAEREARRAPPAGNLGPRSLRRAAEQSGLALDRTSLLGVIQARSGRQALVRMPSGDFRRVSRGDDLDGWRVLSIGRTAMRLTRRGQNRTLLLVDQ